MKRILLLVDMVSRGTSLSAATSFGEDPERGAARAVAAAGIAQRIRPFFSRVVATVATSSEVGAESGCGELRFAEGLEARGIDGFFAVASVASLPDAEVANPATRAVDACTELVEWLRRERVSDVYVLGASPSEVLGAAALACRRCGVRTWAITDTWTGAASEHEVRTRLSAAEVTLIPSGQVDAGCCV